MCRLFGMSGGDHRVRATFWLLEAPDSLARQSRREPDGTGLGWFGADGRPQRLQAAAGGLRGPGVRARGARARVARRSSPTSATPRPAGSTPRNTHPFEQRGRLFAHNGVIDELERLEHELGDDRALVHGRHRLRAAVRARSRARSSATAATSARASPRPRAGSRRELPLYAINLVLGHARRAVGAALPRHARAVRARARRRRPERRPPPRRTPARAGTVRVRSSRPRAPPVGRRRQRADGRGPGLARCSSPASCSTSDRRCRSTRRSSSTGRRPTR